MRILLLGKNGQLGFELQHSLAALGEIIALARADLDLIYANKIPEIIQHYRPNIIINAAAYTAVDNAEQQSNIAYAINATAPQILATEAKKIDAWLVHYSTDYVFDGNKVEPYLEVDKPAPLNVYGHTKLAGEAAIISSGCKHLIFRTSWVFGIHGNNFAKTILNLSRQRNELRIVNDQIGAPTNAKLIAEITSKVLATNKMTNGIYHLTNAGVTSWYGFATALLQTAQQSGIKLQMSDENILPITSKEYNALAARPANSKLNTNKLQTTFDILLPEWQEYLPEFMHDLHKAGC